MPRKLITATLALLIAVLTLPHTITADEQIRLVVQGRYVRPDTPPLVINGRTMVPLRFVAEELGMRVSWDERTRTVTVERPWLKPPVIRGGSEAFRKETQEALNLLRDRFYPGYELVCKSLKAVDEYDIGSDSPISWVTSVSPELCLFNKSLGSIPSDERAVYLCHEATHSAMLTSGIRYTIDSRCSEAIAWLVSYQVAAKLGAKNLLPGIRQEIQKNLP